MSELADKLALIGLANRLADFEKRIKKLEAVGGTNMPPLKAILEAIDKVKSTQHGDIENAILLPTMGNKGLVEVGSLFGLEVYSSDNLPDGVDLIVTPKANLGGQL